MYLFLIFYPIFILFNVHSSIPDNSFKRCHRVAMGVVVRDITIDVHCVASLVSKNVDPLFLEYARLWPKFVRKIYVLNRFSLTRMKKISKGVKKTFPTLVRYAHSFRKSFLHTFDIFFILVRKTVKKLYIHLQVSVFSVSENQPLLLFSENG